MAKYKDITDFLNMGNVKKYDIIYADPPWKFNDRTPQKVLSSSTQYKTMDLNNLINLQISKITSGSILFL